MNDLSNIPIVELPEQLKLLENHGRELANRGQHEDAERLLRELLRSAPDHIPALRYIASRAFMRRDFNEAQRLIEHAIRLTWKTGREAPMLHQHLAIILRAQGYFKGSLLAFDAALRQQPDEPVYWIQRGDVLQALGESEQAVASYKRAADIAGNLAALAHIKQGAKEIQGIILRAAKTLAQAREKAIAQAVAPILRKQGDETLQRVAAAVRHMTRAAPPDYADPLQRPAFSYCPKLDAKPFFERHQFPFLRALKDVKKPILEELKSVLAETNDLEPYVEIPDDREAQWHELNHSSKWSSYHLYKNGTRVAEHCARCPRTTEAIEALPLVRLQGQAPEIFFSILEPGTHIPPHFGLANYKLAVHLPLIVPEGCAIRAGDQTRQWAAGKCLIFDDSFEHEAWNRSDQLRVVLIFEIWHPDLSEVERQYLSTALAAYGNFNAKLDRLNESVLRTARPPTGASTTV